MRIDAALVKEQGVTFVVVAVKRPALDIGKRDSVRAYYSRVFDNVPAVLMAQDGNGSPTYYGRPDIVRLLTNIFVEQLPWRSWDVAA